MTAAVGHVSQVTGTCAGLGHVCGTALGPMVLQTCLDPADVPGSREE